MSSAVAQPDFHNRLMAALKRDQEQARQAVEARKLLPDCPRCKRNKVQGVGFRVCLSCSYC